MSNRLRKKATITDVKYSRISGMEIIPTIQQSNTPYGFSQKGYGNTPGVSKLDLIETDYYVQGVVTAHFTFPVINMSYPEDIVLNSQRTENGRVNKQSEFVQSESTQTDPDIWEGLIFDEFTGGFYPESTPDLPTYVWADTLYGDTNSSLYRSLIYNRQNRDLMIDGGYESYIKGTQDLIFITDDAGVSIAVLNTQFYGNSYLDASVPPNVDSAYIPSRYHIQVGDTLTLYSGRLFQTGYVNKITTITDTGIPGLDDTMTFYYNEWSYGNRYLALPEIPFYEVSPNVEYRWSDGNLKWEDGKITNNVSATSKLPKAKRTSIPLIGESVEASLVQIRGVKLNPKLYDTSGKSTKFIFLEPGRLYEVIDAAGNTISFRVCHGTELARNMPAMQIDKTFNLVGIVAGANRNGDYEIWPRNLYDIGIIPEDIFNEEKLNPNISSVTEQM